MHRNALKYLEKWLYRPNRKPLIIRGARQVGKTTLVELLATQHKRTLVAINAELEPTIAADIETSNPGEILETLAFAKGVAINAKQHILFFDEIQAAPKLLATLRYFKELMPELPVIAAGSLLDFALEAPEFSVPVGRIEYLYLGPMQLDEVLVVHEEQSLLDWMNTFTWKTQALETVHQKLNLWVKRFTILGGLPEVVKQYRLRPNDIESVQREQQLLLTTYIDDMNKYINASDKSRQRAQHIFQSLPRFIAGKLKYKDLDSESPSSQVKSSLALLQLARVIHMIHHSDGNGAPLAAQVNPRYAKALFLDIGLLVRALGLNLQDIHSADELNLVNKGDLAEQWIGQHLLQLQPFYIAPELYFWQRPKSQGDAEIDFLWEWNGAVIPIEVKAGSEGKMRSMHVFAAEKKIPVGVRFYSGPPKLQVIDTETMKGRAHYKLMSLPHYMVSQLPRLLEGMEF